MTNAIETILTTSELTQLAGVLAGRPMSRASDKAAAIIRLSKLLRLHIGDELAETYSPEIFGADSLETAEKKLRGVMAKVGRKSQQELEEEMAKAKALKANEPTKIRRLPEGKVPKAPKEPKAPKVNSADGRTGRTSALSGKTLHAVKDENHRREGTGGHKTMSIILKHPGISVEDCIAKGGRMVDIRWDLDRKHLTAK